MAPSHKFCASGHVCCTIDSLAILEAIQHYHQRLYTYHYSKAPHYTIVSLSLRLLLHHPHHSPPLQSPPHSTPLRRYTPPLNRIIIKIRGPEVRGPSQTSK